MCRAAVLSCGIRALKRSLAMLRTRLSICRLRLWSPRLQARPQAAFTQYRAIGHGAFIDSGEPLELPALHRTGEEITVELSLSPLGDAVAGRRLVLAVIRDVSVRKRGEEARARL